jgi:thiol-disulfide isomerase/thioredoxin
MMDAKRIIHLLAVALFGFFITSLPLLATTQEEVIVVYFYSKNCRSCRKVTPYLNTVATEHPQVRIRAYNIDDKAGQALLIAYERVYNVTKPDRNIVPKVFVRHKYLRGATAIQKQLMDEIVSGSGIPTLTVPDPAE